MDVKNILAGAKALKKKQEVTATDKIRADRALDSGSEEFRVGAELDRYVGKASALAPYSPAPTTAEQPTYVEQTPLERKEQKLVSAARQRAEKRKTAGDDYYKKEYGMTKAEYDKEYDAIDRMSAVREARSDMQEIEDTAKARTEEKVALAPLVKEYKDAFIGILPESAYAWHSPVGDKEEIKEDIVLDYLMTLPAEERYAQLEKAAYRSTIVPRIEALKEKATQFMNEEAERITVMQKHVPVPSYSAAAGMQLGASGTWESPVEYLEDLYTSVKKDDFKSGFVEAADWRDFISFGLASLGGDAAKLQALQKAHKGEPLTEQDEFFIEVAEIEQALEDFRKEKGGASFWNSLGSGAAHSAQFVTEMAMTGSLGGAAKLATGGIKQAFKQGVGRGLAQLAVKNVPKTLAYGAKRSPLMAGTYRNLMDRRINQYSVANGQVDLTNPESLWKSIGVAWADQTFEIASELWGNMLHLGFGKIGKAIGADKWFKTKSVNLKTTPAMRRIFRDGLLWSGDIPSEMTSEFLGDVATNLAYSAFNEDEQYWGELFTWNYWGNLLALTVGLKAGVTVASIPSIVDSNKKMKQLEARSAEAFNAIGNEELKNKVLNLGGRTDIEDVAEYMHSIDWSQYKPIEVAHAIDYMMSEVERQVVAGSESEQERAERYAPRLKRIKELAYLNAEGVAMPTMVTADVNFGADDTKSVTIIQGDYNNPEAMVWVRLADGTTKAVVGEKISNVQETDMASLVAEDYAMTFAEEDAMETLGEVEQTLFDMQRTGASNTQQIRAVEKAGLTVFNEGEVVTLLNGEEATVVEGFRHGLYTVMRADGSLSMVGVGGILQPDVAIAQAQRSAAMPQEQTPLTQSTPLPEDIDTTTDYATPDGFVGKAVDYNAESDQVTLQSADGGLTNVPRASLTIANAEQVAPQEDITENLATETISEMEQGEAEATPMPVAPQTAPIPQNEDGSVDYESMTDATMYANAIESDMGNVADAQGAVVDVRQSKEAELAKLQEQKKQTANMNEKVALKQQEQKLVQQIAMLNEVESILGSRATAVEAETAQVNEAVETAPIAETTEQKKPTEPMRAIAEGVKENDFATQLRNENPAEYNTFNALAKLLGLEIEFVESAGEGNALIVGNKMQVAYNPANREETLRFLIGHESLHRLKSVAPEAYAELMEDVKSYIGEELFGQRVERLRVRYEHQGIAITEESLQEEVVADFIGEMEEDYNVVSDLVTNNPNKSWWQKLIEGLRNLFAFLEGASADTAKVASILNKIETAYKTAAEKVQTLEVETVNGEVSAEINEAEGQAKLSLRNPEWQSQFGVPLADGKELSLEDVRTLFEKTNKRKVLQQMFDKVYEVMEKLPYYGIIVTSQMPEGSEDSLGVADGKGNILLNVRMFQEISNKGIATTILHEMIHSATTYATIAYEERKENPEAYEALPENIKTACQRLQNIYDFLLKRNNLKEEYGMTSIHEMLAELSNPQFRALLREEGVWEKIVNALKRFFGIGTGKTVKELDETLKTFLENFDRSAYVETVEAIAGEKVFERKVDAKEADAYSDVMYSLRENVMQGQPKFSLQASADELVEMEALEEVNTKFNARLLELNDNRDAKNRVLLLGRPHKFLRDAGIADVEIEMEFDKFIRKSSDKYKHAHPFTAEDILDLPKAINAPIAVFVSTNGVDKVILTEIKKDGMNFIVTIKAVERKRKGGVILEVNEIETLYPKKSRGIISWINKKLASNIDKEKALAWVEALRTNRETELTEQELNSATNIIQNFPNPKIEPRNSLKSLDAPYLDAVARGDMATAERLVMEAAKSAGYTEEVYHGTDKFGFTTFNSRRPSGAIFTSDKAYVAANYGGDGKYASVRNINKGTKLVRNPQDVIDNARSVFNQEWRYATEEDKNAVIERVEATAKKMRDEMVSRQVDMPEELRDDVGWIENIIYDGADARENGNEGNELAEMLSRDYELYKESKGNLRNYEAYDSLTQEQKDYLSFLIGYELGDVAVDIGFSYAKAVSEELMATVDGSSFVGIDALEDNTTEAKNLGSYQLYGNLGNNPLEVDAEGKEWFALDFNGMRTTDAITEWAKENGYSSVVFKNIYDYGDKSDVKVFYNSNQLKSADVVTYDDAGNIIPLSERFNPEKEDIRYSLREATSEKLTPAMIRHHMIENVTRHHEQEVNRINRFHDREERQAKALAKKARKEAGLVYPKNGSYTDRLAFLVPDGKTTLPMELQVTYDIANGLKLKWSDSKDGKKHGLSSGLGLGSSRKEGYGAITVGATMYVEDYVAQLMEENNGYSRDLDDNDIRNAVINVLSQYTKPKQAIQALEDIFLSNEMDDAEVEALYKIDLRRQEALEAENARYETLKLAYDQNPFVFEREYFSQMEQDIRSLNFKEREIRNLRLQIRGLRKKHAESKYEQAVRIEKVRKRITDMVGTYFGRNMNAAEIKTLVNLISKAHTPEALERALDMIQRQEFNVQYRMQRQRKGRLLQNRISFAFTGNEMSVEQYLRQEGVDDATIKRLLSDRFKGVDAKGISVAKFVSAEVAKLMELVNNNINLTKDIEEQYSDFVNALNEAMQKVPTALLNNETLRSAIETLPTIMRMYWQVDEMVNSAKTYESDLKRLNDKIKEAEEAITFRPENMSDEAYEERTDQFSQVLKELIQLRDALMRQHLADMPAIVKLMTEANNAIEQMLLGGKQLLSEERKALERHKREVLQDAEMDITNYGQDYDALRADVTRHKTSKERAKKEEKKRGLLSGIMSETFDSLDQILRKMGSDSASGMGRTHQRIMGGLIKATNLMRDNINDVDDAINRKLRQLWGGIKGYRSLEDIIYQSQKIVVGSWNYARVANEARVVIEAGKPRTVYEEQTRTFNTELTLGQALYVLSAWNQADGRLKLEHNGFTQDDINSIMRAIADVDARWLDLMDFVIDELLPSRRDYYDEVHRRVNGAYMARVENYFPLKISGEEVYKEADLDAMSITEATIIPSAIINRTHNTKMIDLDVDFFKVLLENVTDMERWAAMVEIRQDMTTILSDTRTRNMMEQKYGVNFVADLERAMKVAVGTYTCKIPTTAEKALLYITRRWAGSRIAGRISTALKQLVGIGAYITYATSWAYWLKVFKVMRHPVQNIKEALEMFPMLQQRWKSASSGDVLLQQFNHTVNVKTEGKLEWKQFDAWLDKVTRLGIMPNAAVDLFVSAVMAKATYEWEMERYLNQGFSREIAEQKAKIDAELSYNLTQQSAETMFIGSLQASPSLVSRAATTFMNNPIANIRLGMQGFADIQRALKWQRVLHNERNRLAIEYRKQFIAEGMDEEQAGILAEQKALREVQKTKKGGVVWRGIKKMLWGYFLNATTFTLAGGIWLLCKYWDDDEKLDEMGLTGTDLLWTTVASPFQAIPVAKQLTDLLIYGKTSFIPMLDDALREFEGLRQYIENDNVSPSAVYAFSNAVLSLGVGIDMNTWINMSDGVVDMFNGDWDAGVAKLINKPKSQIKLLIGDRKDGETAKEYMTRVMRTMSIVDKNKIDVAELENYNFELGKWEKPTNISAAEKRKVSEIYRQYQAEYKKDMLKRCSEEVRTDYPEIVEKHAEILKDMGVQDTKLALVRYYEQMVDTLTPDAASALERLAVLQAEISATERSLDLMVSQDGKEYIDLLTEEFNLRKAFVAQYEIYENLTK